MNIIDLACFLLFVGAGLLAGSRLGGVIGACCGAAAGWFLLWLISSLNSWELGKAPICDYGKCKSWVDYNRLPDEAGGCFQCRCGHRYLMRGGQRFLKVQPDGSITPYMRRSFWGHWRPDREGNGMETPDRLSSPTPAVDGAQTTPNQDDADGHQR